MKATKIGLLSICICFVGYLFLQSKHKSDPITASKEELGELLFFEPALSLDSSISCASCHIPRFAFADTQAFSKGVFGARGLRNTPSIMNLKSRDIFFYDGRAGSLEDQVHFPIEDINEMHANFDVIAKRLNDDNRYMKCFQRVFAALPNRQNIAEALAAYQRTLETANTPFDAFMSDDSNAISKSAQRGREIFLSEKARCFDCHFGPDFTGDEFKNIGLYDGNVWNDKGRFEITKDSADMGKFKVPGLRNIGVTGPYMHNGKFKTLREVIEYYSNPYSIVKKPLNMDKSLLEPIRFTEAEKTDLLNFLLSLTDRQFSNR